jgi:hypothetical protein
MFLTLLVYSLSGVPLSTPRPTPDVTRLSKLRPVTVRDCDVFDNPFSIAGVAFEGGFRLNGDTGFAVYSIPPGTKSLDCYVGQDDSRRVNPGQIPSYAVYLDGEKVESGSRAGGNTKPAHISLNVEQVHSVKFEMSYAESFGNPTFSTDPGESNNDQKSVKLLSPADKASVSGPYVELSWSSVEGATSYVVEITAEEFDADVAASAPKIFCTTATGPKIRISTDRLLPARYSWTVLAFGPRKAIGQFSDERIFVLKK